MEGQLIFETARTLGIASQLFQSRMESLLVPLGLTYTQLAVLSHLSGQDGGQSISDLAAAFEIQQPGMSKVVKRLQLTGSVAVETDQADPRRKLVTITAEGRSRFESAGLALEADISRWFTDWPDEELVQFVSSLGRLIGWLDKNRLAKL